MRNVYILVFMTFLTVSHAKNEKRKTLIISVDESKPEDTDAVISDLNLEEQSSIPSYRTKPSQYSAGALQQLPEYKQHGYILLTPENIERLKNAGDVIVEKPKYITYPSGRVSESYDSSRNPSPGYSYKYKYPLSPSSETGDHHYSPQRNKYPERPAPPLSPLSSNRTYADNYNNERPVSSQYNSPESDQYSSYNSAESVKPEHSSRGGENSYENVDYEKTKYPSPYRPRDPSAPSYQHYPPQNEPVSYSKSYDGSSYESYPPQNEPVPYSKPYDGSSHESYPPQKEAVPYSKPYDGSSHESYPPKNEAAPYSKPYDGSSHDSYSSSEKFSRPPSHNGYSSPQTLPYDPKFDTVTSLYSPKPRSPQKFRYYTAPKTTNNYPVTYGSESYSSKPYDEAPKFDLPKQSRSKHAKPSLESYISSKETYSPKDNPESYVSYNNPTYGTRSTPASHTNPHSNVRYSKPTYDSGNYVSKEVPYSGTDKYSSNYDAEPYTGKHPTYKVHSPYQTDVGPKSSYDKDRSTSSEVSPYKPYDYPSKVRNTQSAEVPYVPENYRGKSVSTVPGKISKPASYDDSSSYDAYRSRKYPVAYDSPPNTEVKNYDSSLVVDQSYDQGAPEISKPLVTRFYNTPIYSNEKRPRYAPKYSESTYSDDLPKSSYRGSAKPFKYSVDGVGSPTDASYYNSPSTSGLLVNKSPSYSSYQSPSGHETSSEIQDSHSVRKNFKPSRPAPLYDQYDQPRHPPLPNNPNESSEKYSNYENVENKPITSYGKSAPESSYDPAHGPNSYKSSYIDDQNGKYYPSSVESGKSHYTNPASKEYYDEPAVYTKTITKTVAKPHIISDGASYYDDRSTESQYNKPNLNSPPVKDYSTSNDKVFSYNPNSYSKSYPYSEPTGSSEEYSYAKPPEKKFTSSAENDASYTYSGEKPKRVEGVVYRSRKTYPDLTSPRRQKSYLPYKAHNPKTSPAFHSEVYKSPSDKNLTESPRKSSIELKYKPMKNQDSTYDNSYEDTGLSNIPGEPGKDFPILKAMPYTHFSCENRAPGFYADTQHRCQVYYQCSDKGRMQSFLCPNGTIFNQETFVCEWWHNVDCTKSEKHFAKNNDLYKPNLPLTRDHVDTEKYTSGRTHPYEEYPASVEYSPDYRQEDESKRRRYVAKPRKRSRSKVTYDTSSS